MTFGNDSDFFNLFLMSFLFFLDSDNSLTSWRSLRWTKLEMSAIFALDVHSWTPLANVCFTSWRSHRWTTLEMIAWWIATQATQYMFLAWFIESEFSLKYPESGKTLQHCRKQYFHWPLVRCCLWRRRNMHFVDHLGTNGHAPPGRVRERHFAQDRLPDCNDYGT